MYKALHTLSGEEIVILSPKWRNRIERLREMDHKDLLVCQGCRQPLRVKAGELKRPHFAHKHLQACSFGSETPEILNARAVLYDWLLEQFGLAVTVEKQIEGSNLPRPVDCWVETSAGSFAYWIFENGIKLDPRIAIKTAFELSEIKIHYVFLSKMLVEEKKEFHSLLLSPTERTFLRQTPFDEMLAGRGEIGRSLHYLDVDEELLVTFRGLLLFHRPNWFRGLKKTAPLASVRASSQTGDFVYPGESDRLFAYQQRQLKLAQKRKQYEARQESQSDRPPELFQAAINEVSRNNPLPKKGARERNHLPEGNSPVPLRCVTCGKITTDYWSVFTGPGGERLCRCRECLGREASNQ